MLTSASAGASAVMVGGRARVLLTDVRDADGIKVAALIQRANDEALFVHHDVAEVVTGTELIIDGDYTA